MKTPAPLALLGEAAAAARAAHCPYSGYPVGAAVLARDGTVHRGCNVENASFGLTLCAERNALCAAVAAGRRAFAALAVVAVAAPGDRFPYPCGACRQVMAEFLDADTPVYVAAADRLEEHVALRFGDLLPLCFKWRRADGGPPQAGGHPGST